MIVGPGGNSFIGGALNYSADSAGLVGNIGSFLPLGFAFAAGMVATVNPCGFVMLPAFLTMYLTDQQGDASDASEGRTAAGISRSLILFGTREVDHKIILERVLEPDMTVFDIGANIGYHVLME